MPFSHWILVLALARLATANVTVQIMDVPPIELSDATSVTSVNALFAASCPEEVAPENPYPSPDVFLSRFSDLGDADIDQFANATVFPSSGSVVRGAIDAWANHQHLILRPDEIWFEVLAQLNFYMSANAETVRFVFVGHEGRKELVVKEPTWGEVLAGFADAIQKSSKIDWLVEWVMPRFSTSTDDDRITATVLMMGLMQQYFEFTGGIICGIPAVTLRGTRDDWHELYLKLNYLSGFGMEPEIYAEYLRPIFQRFYQTFDEPDSDETKEFWSQIVRAKKQFTCGTGAVEYTISGWITGFMHWVENGTRRISAENIQDYVDMSPDPVVLDQRTYLGESLAKIPVGYAKAPIKMLDYPEEGDTTYANVLAGNVISLKHTDGEYVTSQPLGGWFLYGPIQPNITTEWHGNSGELEDIASAIQPCSLQNFTKSEHTTTTWS